MITTRQIGKASFSILINGVTLLAIGAVLYLAWLRINQQSLPIHIVPHELTQKNAPINEKNDIANSNFTLPPYQSNTSNNTTKLIFREATYLTVIPDRPPTDILTYTVKSGDTLFSIADLFHVKPTTLLWGNYEVLQDNPHFLKPGQVLNVLPVDGIYYQWQEGDTLEKVANDFKANLNDILNFTGNNIDLTKINQKNSGIEPKTWIVIPGGRRPIKDWGPPAITRKNPATARGYGAGACGEVYEGAVGTGSFVWPTTDHNISGYNYDPEIHPAIDIGGQTGNPVFAADSGVVVYAGWSDYGYGNLIVIDHGNGWQTAYAHLNSIAVTCGMSVFKGGGIGTLGATGNATGPHLHFEMIYNGTKVNPLGYVQ